MRIGFVNHARRKVGGAEVYLDAVIPALAAAGHDIAYAFEGEGPSGHELIRLPASAPQWPVETLGREATLNRLKNWKPDVCFTHGLHDTHFEAAIAALGHSALYVHNYYGMCISGDKTRRNGTVKQCELAFGAGCLLHYFPDRCGGRSPFTMWKQFRLQSRRLEVMRTYNTLIANSHYIAAEMSRHGLKCDSLYPFTGASEAASGTAKFHDDSLVIVFAGRIQQLKGGHLLVAAAPEIQRRLGRKLRVVFAGDGPERANVESAAANLRGDSLQFEFTGWVGGEAIRKKVASAHLLAMPSIWPEPFGLSGLEAGLSGVPAVAFAVGGIPEWLHDALNGHLAALPATSQTLADACVRALADSNHYDDLRRGALAESGKFSMQSHIDQLIRIFERCAA